MPHPLSPKLTLIGLLMMTATSAATQDLCGGIGSDGRWIGNDEAGSDIAAADTHLEQMALVFGGNEYVSLFTLSTGQDIRVEAAGRGSGDPIIDLLDATGTVILSDDDSGGDGAARAETFLDPGTYCMSLRSYDGGPMTAFVRIGLSDHEPLTSGEDSPVATDDNSPARQSTPTNQVAGCASATPLGGIGARVSGAVSETPYWSFDLESPTAITITGDNPDADPKLSLYDASNSLIADNDDFDGLNARIDVTSPLDAGSYCIGVEALNDEDAPIAISLQEFDPVAVQLALYDKGEASPPLDGSHPVTDMGLLETQLRQEVQATGEVSWFHFNVTENSVVFLHAIAVGNGDPWIIMYDDLGRELEQNDDTNGERHSQIARKVVPGTYIVGIRQFDDSNGVIRLVAERYVPAQ